MNKLARIAAVGTLSLAAACGSSGAAGPGLPGGPPPPAAGAPRGRSSALIIDAAGGSLTFTGSAGDTLVVTVPAGAVAAPVDFTLVEIAPDTAPGAAGSAFRLGPAGTALALPLTLAFSPPAGVALDTVTCAHQGPLGYWLRVYAAARDSLAGTVSVQTTELGDWSLATVATQLDLAGNFRLDSTLGVTFTASGSVTLQNIGQDGTTLYYLPVGTIAAAAPILDGTASCTPDPAGPAALPASVADLRTAPAAFFWGINGHWNLTCSDGQPRFASTSFDTLGITNLGCARGYSASNPSSIDPAHVQGQYVIDCGGGRKVVAAWDLVPPGQTPAPLPLP